MEQPIIVGVADADEARDAVAFGVDLARGLGAPLVVAGICVPVPGPAEVGHLDLARDQTERRLQDALQRVPPDVDASLIVRVARSPVQGLHELAEHRDAAALVLGPTHLGRAGRALLGDVALIALHAAPCAVAVAPDGYAERAGSAPRTIGVGLVDTPEARDALDLAIDLAERLGARLRLIHVETGAQAAASAQLLEPARATVADRVAVETDVRRGDVGHELAAAGEDLDLLVLGSRAYGPLQRLLLGSVSRQVVHAARCPLLVLPRSVRRHAEVIA